MNFLVLLVSSDRPCINVSHPATYFGFHSAATWKTKTTSTTTDHAVEDRDPMPVTHSRARPAGTPPSGSAERRTPTRAACSTGPEGAALDAPLCVKSYLHVCLSSARWGRRVGFGLGTNPMFNGLPAASLATRFPSFRHAFYSYRARWSPLASVFRRHATQQRGSGGYAIPNKLGNISWRGCPSVMPVCRGSACRSKTISHPLILNIAM